MRAFLLAAGFGTRLQPLTLHTPKCLVGIGGRPLLDHWLELLFDAGISRVLLNTHWLAHQVRRHVARSPWAARVDLVHEEELLGTGGAVLANRQWLQERPFLLAHADNLTDFDVRGLLEAHAKRPAGHVLTMLGFRTDAPRACGILALDGRGTVIGFHEKVQNPPGNLANAAVYVCEPDVVGAIAAMGKPVVDLSTEVLPGLVGRMQCVETKGYHRDIGTPESLAWAQAEFPAVRRAAQAATREEMTP
jgi:mannose-1-phosphate guanylyltransferase